jgi:hypothetical protein
MEIEERTEVSRDEFGGYCCKRWGKLEEMCSDESIYGLLNLNIEEKARAIVLKDQERKEVQKPETQNKIQVLTPKPLHVRPKIKISSVQVKKSGRLQDNSNLKMPQQFMAPKIEKRIEELMWNTKPVLQSASTAIKSPLTLIQATPFSMQSPLKTAFVSKAPEQMLMTPSKFLHCSPASSPF